MGQGADRQTDTHTDHHWQPSSWHDTDHHDPDHKQTVRPWMCPVHFLWCLFVNTTTRRPPLTGCPVAHRGFCFRWPLLSALSSTPPLFDSLACVPASHSPLPALCYYWYAPSMTLRLQYKHLTHSRPPTPSTQPSAAQPRPLSLLSWLEVNGTVCELRASCLPASLAAALHACLRPLSSCINALDDRTAAKLSSLPPSLPGRPLA